MSVSIKYKGSEIAALTATGTKTLNTEGKYCEGNIIVENTEASHQEVEQATPSLSLNAATGEVTAEATQAAGLVAAGTKKATMQLATQAAKTVTPSAAQQTAVTSGKYTTGDVVVAAVPTEAKTVELSMPSGDQTVSPDAGKFLSAVTVKKPATMLPENIKKGVSIGGVVGTLESGGGGGGSTGETTQLQVNAISSVVDRPLYCVWQTNDGWMGSQSFATLTSFTVPNVIVGGYVIFMRDPMEQAVFSASDAIGVEFPPVAAMDQENDIADGALVVIVTAPSPSFNLKLLPQS